MEDQEKETSFVHCASCNASLAFGTFFCGKCGSAQLQTMLLPGNKLGHSVVQNSTTADYDPSNPDNKPWKETSHLKNRPTLPPKITLESKRAETPPPAVPWKPTMKQMSKKEDIELVKRRAIIKKAKGLPPKGGAKRTDRSNEITVVEKGVEKDIDSIIADEISQAGAGEVIKQKLVYYKNYAFKKRGEKARKVKVKPKEKQWDDSYHVLGEQTFVHPVAVYEAEWIATQGFTIHASLMVRCHGDKKDEHVMRYFLRVGATYEDPKLKEAGYNAERVATADGGRYSRKGKRVTADGEIVQGEGISALAEVESVLPKETDNTPKDLVILGIFQNDVGRLLTKPQQYWVDLNLIRPDEYYMASYLQASLEFVAKRVHVTPSFNLARIVDQVSLVEPLDNSFSLPDSALRNTGGLNIPPKMAVITEQDLALFKRRHKRALLRKKLENKMTLKQAQAEVEEERRKKDMEDPTYRAEEPGSPSALLTITVPKFETPSEIRQRQAYERELRRKNRAATAALGPPGGEMSLSMDKTVAQRSCRIPIGKIYENRYVLTIARLSINYPDPEFLLSDALPRRSEDPEAGDLLYADVEATEVVLHLFPMYAPQYAAPKIMSLEAKALPVLLGADFIGVDQVLKEGFDATAKLLEMLTGLLHFYSQPLPADRFGVVKEQLKVGITGVAVIPFVREPDEVDSDSDSEEVASTATFDFAEEVSQELIDTMVKETLFDMRRVAEEERLHRLYLESWGSVAIQRIIRGHICRVKRLIPKKREQRRILRERARAGAIKMQSVVRMFLSRVPVRNRKLEVARIKREKELEEEAKRWAAQVAAQEAALAAQEQELREKEAAEAAREAARKARLDRCWCHDHVCWRLDTVLKDTDMHLFGRFLCCGICEHDPDGNKKTLLASMHDDAMAMSYVKREGRFEEDKEESGISASMWVLRLGVVEAVEGDGLDGSTDGALSLTEEEKPDQDVVTIYGDDLCHVAETIRKERVLMRREQEEVEDVYEEETDAEKELNQEDAPEKVLNRSMLESTGHVREEIFRRCCSGISVGWKYDGSLQATFNMEAVVENHQGGFYDEDGDLVMGI